MENESKKESETDKSVPRHCRKAGLKFAPKVSPNNASKIIPKKKPQEESKVATIDKELMLRLGTLKSTNAIGSRAKAEKQETPIQVAFGQADPSVLRTFSSSRSSSSDVPAAKLPKKLDDPWDYTSTNYPVTLPLRRPYDRKDEPQLLFFQLPRSLPLRQQADHVAEADTDNNVDANAKFKGGNMKGKPYPIHGCGLRELPGGLMGKILVYKSGKVKMKLGDAHFDVSAGCNCSFAQEAVVVDTREKNCSSLGEIGKRLIVTPDIEYLLGCIKME